jgi:D-alanine-D-alanine ligase
MHKRKVGIIFGGRSGEHEVSLASARSVMAAIDRDKFEVVPIGITKDGHWIASGDPLKALESGRPQESRPAALLGDPSQRGLVRLDDGHSPLATSSVAQLDVIFPMLHGPYGEDGTVQGLLELADIPYVGAGVLGSALGMDKIAMKDIFRSHSLPVVRYLPFRRRDWLRDPESILGQVEAELGYPCFTKPANLGSSVGITKAHDREELVAGMDEAASYDRRVLVEEGINAREIEVSVLGNDAPIASVPGEVVPCNEFYDYAAKYVDEDSDLIIPAPISAELTERVRQLAVEAYLSIDCAGMARADFLLDRDNGALYVSELNTIPGFTPISMYPKLWEATGLSYPELIDRLIDLALERHEERSRSRTSYTVT